MQIAPFFKGKDATKLDALIDELYLYKNNYKLSGLALWCCQAWVEFALLDMLGKIAGKSTGELLGDIRQTEVKMYSASGNRGNTPEEEIEVLKGKTESSGAKAVMWIRGRTYPNQVHQVKTDILPISK